MDARDHRVVLERPDVNIEGGIEDLAVGVQPVVRDETRDFVGRLIRVHFAQAIAFGVAHRPHSEVHEVALDCERIDVVLVLGAHFDRADRLDPIATRLGGRDIGDLGWFLGGGFENVARSAVPDRALR